MAERSLELAGGSQIGIFPLLALNDGRHSKDNTTEQSASAAKLMRPPRLKEGRVIKSRNARL